MRRIVIIAASLAGIACGTRLKRRLPDSEVNIVLPSSLERLLAHCASPSAGPAARRLAPRLPDLAALAGREVGLLEANDIMPDLGEREVTVASSRGSITIRYTHLALEAPATARLPRMLSRAANLFAWPMPDFAAEPEACDAALAEAAERGETVLVIGAGMPALDAVFLAREAGAQVCWLRTGERGAPEADPLLLEHALVALGPDVREIALPNLMPEALEFSLNAEDGRLVGVALPDGEAIPVHCCLWATRIMSRHPILREPGVILDGCGRLAVEDEALVPGLRILGSGAALPAGFFPGTATPLPVSPGTPDIAECAAERIVADLAGGDPDDIPGPLGLAEAGLDEADLSSIRLCAAGYSIGEAQRLEMDAEYALVDHIGADDLGEPTRLILALLCLRASRTLVGVQVLGINRPEGETQGLYNTALAALHEGTRVDRLRGAPLSGLSGQLLRDAAGILRNKLDTNIKGITPDELLASRAAGAEFFTLDLRSELAWKQGHVLDAHNIPLPQLKKRLQAEVPHFTPLVLISEDGRDAYATACKLAALGASSLYVLDGGMRLWPYELEF